MSERNGKTPTQNMGRRAATSGTGVLVEFYKALKAIAFYPEGHPLRGGILQSSHQAIIELMEGQNLSLAVQRNGLSFVDRDETIDNNRMTQALAKELFSREIQRLTMHPDLSVSDFVDFLSLLSLDPQRIIAEGGMAKLLEQNGIKAVNVNEIDIAAVFTKRSAPEFSWETVAGESGSQGAAGDHREGVAGEGDGGSAEEAGEAGGVPPESAPREQLEELSAEELLNLMETEPDVARYRQMARLLGGKGEALKLEGSFDQVFPLLLGLLNQNADEGRNEVQRTTALDTFHELARGGMTDHLLGRLADEHYRQKEIVCLILHHLGGEAVSAIIEEIATVESESVRKNLATALLRIGPAAVPPLLAFLKDGRWQVVCAAVTALGEIGGKDVAGELAMTAYHGNNRVRSEAIRALAQIGGREATEALVNLLEDKNRSIRRQAILWLGISRNEKALQPLLDLIMKRDFAGKTTVLKKEALLAVDRIGDKKALEPLYRLVRKRHLVFPGRWDDLKVLAVEIIGRLGGDDAREFLAGIALRRGPVGRAGSAALKAMDQTMEESHD